MAYGKKKRDFHDPFENQKPNSDAYRKGWDKIFKKPERRISDAKSQEIMRNVVEARLFRENQ